jgi:hypothetical protein
MNYFKSYYQSCSYSPNWYGTLDYAPSATILLYNDNECYCIGYMESELPNEVIPLTEEEALAEISQSQDIDGVYFGDKLLHRWDGDIDG